jgi:hypothetical protein
MRFAIRETADSIEYVLLDRGSITDEQLSEMFYTQENGVYLRRYAKQNLMFRHDFAAIEVNYNRHQAAALGGGFTAAQMEAALAWTIDSLNSNGIKWWLTGRAALFARGLDVSPHDIDIMTWKTEISSIELAFGRHIIEPFEHTSGWVLKGFGVIDRDFRIDIAFEPEADADADGVLDFGPYAESHLENIRWRGHQIRVPPLKAQLLSNDRRKRTKVVELIRAEMERTGTL